MALWTVILKSGDHMHVTQVRAEAADEAFRRWGEVIGRAPAAGHPSLSGLTLSDEEPAQTSGLLNLFTASVFVEDRLEMVHLVRTHGVSTKSGQHPALAGAAEPQAVRPRQKASWWVLESEHG
jgi:hypothetical protein